MQQDGNTALMLAAYNGHLNVVKGLLYRNANTHATNRVGPSGCETQFRDDVLPHLCSLVSQYTNMKWAGHRPMHGIT